jgi:methyl-accepting chemotaxis protein
MKNTWTIGKKLTVGFGAMCALAAVLVSVAWMGMRSLGDKFETAADKDATKLDLSSQLATTSSEILSFERGEMLRTYMHDQKTVESYHNSAVEMVKHEHDLLDRVAPLIYLEQGKRDVAEMLSTLQPLQDVETRLNDLCKANKPEAASKIYAEQALPALKALNKTAQDFADLQRKLLAGDIEKGHADISRTLWITIGALVVFAVIGVIVMLVVVRATGEFKTMVSELAQGQDQIGSAATQVASSSSRSRRAPPNRPLRLRKPPLRSRRSLR